MVLNGKNAASDAGRLDISFNLISHGVLAQVRTTFLTWRAAARHMVRQGGGVILAFGGSGPPFRGASLGALQTGFHAVEAMRRQLGSELGRSPARSRTRRCSAGRPRSRTSPRSRRSWPPTRRAR